MALYPVYGVAFRSDRHGPTGAACLEYGFAQRAWSRWMGSGRGKQNIARMRKERGLHRYTPPASLRMRHRVAMARLLPDGITTGIAASMLSRTPRRTRDLMRMAGFAGQIVALGSRGRAIVWRRPAPQVGVAGLVEVAA